MANTYNVQKRMLYSRNLNITWGDNSNYWSWLPLRETTSSETQLVEVAVLEAVCWLDVSGKFDTRDLTPETDYEVVYVVKLEDESSGWEAPVTMKLTLPNNNTQEESVNLKEHVARGWVYIPAGVFRTTPENAGEISFSMYEHDNGHWKKGLYVKGVEIRPIN